VCVWGGGGGTELLTVKTHASYIYHCALKGMLTKFLDRHKEFIPCNSGVKLRAGCATHDNPRC
jgi:hypothetical protein